MLKKKDGNIMLKWYKNLYIGENAKKDHHKMIWKIKIKKKQEDVYLITLASNDKNILDIIETSQLEQEIVRRNCPLIVGIALGYADALELVQKIVEETYQTQGNVDIRKYLQVKSS